VYYHLYHLLLKWWLIFLKYLFKELSLFNNCLFFPVFSQHFLASLWVLHVDSYAKLHNNQCCSRLFQFPKVINEEKTIIPPPPTTTTKTRNITLPTKVHLVKAMVFPIIMHGYESWTINKAEFFKQIFEENEPSFQQQMI